MAFSCIVVLVILVLLLISPQYFIVISEVIDEFNEKRLFCI